MNVYLRNFLLKSIPYLLSIAGGAILFWVTVHKIVDPEMQDLVNNIAASLLSIPLVFLLYDYSNYLISRKLNQTITQTTHIKIDGTLINLAMIVRQMLNMRGKLTLAGLNSMRRLNISEITSRIKMTSEIQQNLRECHNTLDSLIYHNTTQNVLSMVQVQSLAGLQRDLSLLINTHKFHQNRRTSAEYTEKIIRFITDWMDSDAADSVHFQELLANNAMDATRPVTHRKKTKIKITRIFS